MKTFVVGIEAQPDFPQNDLSDANAEALELLMANLQLVEVGHQAAETAQRIFRFSHPAIAHVAEKIDFTGAQQGAVNHGVAVFEAMSAMICAELTEISRFNTIHQSSVLQEQMSVEVAREHVFAAYESFRSEVPRTASVVASSSERYVRGMTAYALVGAAAARQFAIECSQA